MNKSLESLDKFKLLYESKCKEQPKNLIGFDMCYITIKQDLELLKKINKVWHDNEPMESVDINGKHLQDLYDYNEELFNKNLELDKKVIELEKENEELKEQLEINETLSNAFEKQAFEVLHNYEQLKNAIKKFVEYLHKEPNREIRKHSILQIFNKFLNEVLKDE